LNYLVEKVIEHPEYNNKEKLIELIRNKYKWHFVILNIRGKNIWVNYLVQMV
jgi:hypothetical protein